MKEINAFEKKYVNNKNYFYFWYNQNDQLKKDNTKNFGMYIKNNLLLLFHDLQNFKAEKK